MIDRVIPHDLAAEEAVLGALLVANEQIDAVSERVAPGDFFRDAHQRVYRAITTLHRAGAAADLVTVPEALRAAGDLEAVGVSTLAALTDGVPRSVNAVHYAGIVREKATLRALIVASQRTLAEAYAAEGDAQAIVEQAQQALFGITVQRGGGGFVSALDIVTREVMPYVEQLHANPRGVSGVPSGLVDLDAKTRGFQPSDLILVAARPGQGKTSLAISLSVAAALRHNAHVGFFSLEMSRKQILLRAVIAEARLDAMRVMTGRLYGEEWTRFSYAMNAIGSAPWHIDDTSQLTIEALRARARRLKALVGLDLLVVDYIQLMRTARPGENRNLELAEISGGLKAIAKDLEIPVIALAQLNRDVERRAAHRPVLADLRDSGSLESDADLVVFIYRDDAARREGGHVVELLIEKQRNGPTGAVIVGFDAAQTRFYNHTPERAA